MSKSVQNNTLIGGIVIGSAVGVLLGLSIAPRSGKETRKILKKSAAALPELTEDLASTIQMQGGRLSETTKRNWQGTILKLREAIAAGVAASQREMEREKSLTLSQELKPAESPSQN